MVNVNCTNTSAPVTIDHTDNLCLNKCNLQYKFISTGASCTLVDGASSNKSAISILPNNNKETPITFSSSPSGSGSCSGGGGTNEYTLHNINLYSPSIHTYGSQKLRTQGEAIMMCLNSSGGRGLYISIPITQSGNLSSASNQVSEIISFLKTTTTGGSISGFTLNLNEWLKPGKPFYAYTGTSIPGIFNCGNDECVDWIVYDSSDLSIGISTSKLNDLQRLIQTQMINPVDKVAGNGYAFNSSGASSKAGSGSDLVIDCTPVSTTGQSLIKTDAKFSLFGEQGSNLAENAELAAIAFIAFVGLMLFGIFVYSFWKLFFPQGQSGGAERHIGGKKRKIKKNN